MMVNKCKHSYNCQNEWLQSALFIRILYWWSVSRSFSQLSRLAFRYLQQKCLKYKCISTKTIHVDIFLSSHVDSPGRWFSNDKDLGQKPRVLRHMVGTAFEMFGALQITKPCNWICGYSVWPNMTHVDHDSSWGLHLGHFWTDCPTSSK